MNFSPNKTPIEIIKEGAFGGAILEKFILVLMRVVQKFMERIFSVKKY